MRNWLSGDYCKESARKSLTLTLAYAILKVQISNTWKGIKPMKVSERKVTVDNVEYTVYSDLIARATYAVDPAGQVRALKTGGYIRTDASIKKAVRIVFAAAEAVA